jgi:ABC-type transport system substrate-binding protein
MGTAGLNIANYSDPIGDRLIEEGRRRSSHEIRVDMYQQFQEIWARSAPSVILAYPRYTYIQSADIEAVVPAFLPAAHLRFLNIHEWDRP